MKKILLILFCLPMIGFGQEIKGFTITDLIINQVLENSFSHINNKNKFKHTFNVDVPMINNNINWNDLHLPGRESNYYNNKWKIRKLNIIENKIIFTVKIH